MLRIYATWQWLQLVLLGFFIIIIINNNNTMLTMLIKRVCFSFCFVIPCSLWGKLRAWRRVAIHPAMTAAIKIPFWRWLRRRRCRERPPAAGIGRSPAKIRRSWSLVVLGNCTSFGGGFPPPQLGFPPEKQPISPF